ncbi:hypothetical protein GCM10028774_65600 [Spirosoma jeollabukense]
MRAMASFSFVAGPYPWLNLIQPNPSSDTVNPEVPTFRVFMLNVFGAKLGRKGEPFRIQITGLLTTITDWEGRDKKDWLERVSL